jgi:hypothetical protein
MWRWPPLTGFKLLVLGLGLMLVFCSLAHCFWRVSPAFFSKCGVRDSARIPASQTIRGSSDHSAIGGINNDHHSLNFRVVSAHAAEGIAKHRACQRPTVRCALPGVGRGSYPRDPNHPAAQGGPISGEQRCLFVCLGLGRGFRCFDAGVSLGSRFGDAASFRQFWR